jgi:transposase
MFKSKQTLKKILEPLLGEAKSGTRQVFFMDAAHFVRSAFLGVLWSAERIFIKSPTGRDRFNVLGALNAVSQEVITIENTSYVNSLTVCSLLEKLRDRYPDSPISIVLDNASYQRCHLVKARALELEIDLVFLPPYSPNLNLIERLWKFVKKTCLYSKYYETFFAFHSAISFCVSEAHLLHKSELESLLTLKFQTFDKMQVMNV